MRTQRSGRGRGFWFSGAAVVAFVVVSLLTFGSASAATHSVSSSGSSRSSGAASLFPAFGPTSSTTSRLLAATGCGPSGSLADASGFEDADGNLAIDTVGCMDWNGFTPTWTGTAPFQAGSGSNNGFTFAGATDAVNTTSDNIYAGGVKQDTACPATVTGKANDKSDLAAMYVSGERIGDQVYVFLAWERQLDTTVNSDVFVSFEFNQGNVSCGAGSPFVLRTPGDLLVEYNFQSGNSTIDVQQWDGSTWQPLPTPPFEAAVNQGTATDTIRPDGPVDLTQFEFGEAGINLTGLDLSGNGGKACETFGGVLGGSRTSKSGDTAQLKDFVGPAPLDLSNCVQPSVTTTLKNAADDSTIADGSSIANGSNVYDTATLGNLVNGETPTGQVQYTFFANGDCSGTGTSAGLVTLNADGSVPNSETEGPLAAGDYSFEAQYLSGNDAHYSDSEVSACEPFTVLTASPTITTTPSETTGSVGDLLNDSATLSGGSHLDGTITFNLYGPNDPTCVGEPAYSETVPADHNGSDYSTSNSTVTADEAGTWNWTAEFSGDGNNNPASSGCGEEAVVIHGAAIHIVKTADAAKVNVGSPIGFTMTVFNGGDGDATGVQLKDTLPTNPGLSWSIASQGSGWAGSCAISSGVLSCGPATVPGGTTQAASTFTVHIVSGTTAATGGDCPGSGTVNNTGSVTASNDGTDHSSASTCVQALVDLSITKAGSPATQTLGTGNITWTIVVTNNGPNADSGVTIADPMPGGNTFVSATTTKGSCTGGAILNCTIGNMAAGESVTITLVTKPSTVGNQTNTVTVVGNRPETNTANNTATATVAVTQAPFPPPQVFCVAVSKVTPKQLFVGRNTTVTIHVTKQGKAIKGVRVLIKGPKVNLRTKPSNSKGVIKQQVKMKKAGIVTFTPVASKKCNTKRIGVTGVFTPPVTG